MHPIPNHIPTASRVNWYRAFSPAARGLHPALTSPEDRLFAAAFVIGYGV